MNKTLVARMQLPVLCLALAFTSACSTVSPEQLSAVEAKATSAISDARRAAGDAAAALKTAQAAQATARFRSPGCCSLGEEHRRIGDVLLQRKQRSHRTDVRTDDEEVSPDIRG